jgi:transmembrane sensor
MSNVSQFYNKQDVQEQACLWISRMDRGLSISEKQDLTAWINQNKAHHNVLLEMAAYWDDLSVLNELSGLFPLENTPKKVTNKFINIAMAASIALGSFFSANFFINHYAPSFSNEQIAQSQSYKTDIGKQARFVLADGTNIQLNTNSVVNVTYTEQQRKITLVRGEAYFEVAKDKTRPFTVTAGKKSFTALGTIFNVQKKSDLAMELVVTEGRVLITKASEPLETITNSFNISSIDKLPGTLVVSGEKATIEHNLTSPVKKVSLDQVQRDLAWQQGMLIFEGEPLAQALMEVGRYTETQFKITEPHLANLKVAGYFKAGDIEGLLASLESNFNITSTQGANNTIKLSLAN